MDILLKSRVLVEAQDFPALVRGIGVVTADGQVARDPLSLIDRYLSALTHNKLALEREITLLRRAQNRSLLINSLPNNVLTDIFSLVVDDIQDKTLRLVALSQVCSSWRAIVVNRPKLWTTFSLVHVEATRLHLARSGSMLLHVVVDKPDESAEKVLEIFEPIYPQLHRIKSLNIASWNSGRLVDILACFRNWAEPDMPLQLEELSLTGTPTPIDDGMVPPGIPPFHFELRIGRHVFELRSLTLNNVKLNVLPKSHQLCALRRLELTFEKTTQVPASNVLTRLLTHCPMLEEFSLRTTVPIKYVNVNYNLHHPLVHLKSVTIEGVNAGTVDAISQILSSILFSGRSSIPNPTPRTQDGSSSGHLHRPFVALFMDLNDACSEGFFYEDNPPQYLPQRLIHPVGLRCLHVFGYEGGSLVLHGFYDPVDTDAADTTMEDVQFVFRGVRGGPALQNLTLAAWPLDVSSVETLRFMHDVGTGAPVMPIYHTDDCVQLFAQMPALETVETHEARSSVTDPLFNVLRDCAPRIYDGSDDGRACPHLSRIRRIKTYPANINFAEAIDEALDKCEERVPCEVNIRPRDHGCPGVRRVIIEMNIREDTIGVTV